MWKFWSSLVLWGCAWALGYADTALLKDPAVRSFVTMMVQQHHFNRQSLEHDLQNAVYQPQIIDAMEKPYEKKTWDVYRNLFLTAKRLQAGLTFWNANRSALAQAEARYGVPASVIVAIIGVETLYGEYQGNYRVLDALTTLAFYYPKRAPFFTKELKEYFLLCREHHVSPLLYHGSYAGAIGKPQFMPSSYRFYAVDFLGKGRPDLIHNDRDVIMSVANYFHRNGWKQHGVVAEPALVRSASSSIEMNTKYAQYSYQSLKKAGIQPKYPHSFYPLKAGVLALATPQGSEYWMAYPNFYVITRYNASPQYALVVYLFSKQLQEQWAFLQQHHRQQA